VSFTHGVAADWRDRQIPGGNDYYCFGTNDNDALKATLACHDGTWSGTLEWVRPVGATGNLFASDGDSTFIMKRHTLRSIMHSYYSHTVP
jgi:hypothetical protein